MKRHFQWVGTLLSLSLFSVALWSLHHELKAFHYHQISAQLRGYPSHQILLALGLTFLSYFILTGYDALGLRYAGKPLPFKVSAPASFISYVFSNNLGFSAITGGLVRYRIYSSFGIYAFSIGKVVVFCALTFWVGLFSLGGTVFLLDPLPIPEVFHAPFQTTFPIGLLFLTISGAYLTACVFVRKPILWREWSLELPTYRLALGQLLLGTLDWTAASAVLFVLLPAGTLSLPHLMGIFILAQVLGMVSQVPGGLGVFETASMLMLKPYIPATEALGALMVFRGLYYLLPLGLASLMFAGQEVYRRGEYVKKGVKIVGRWTGPAAPWAFSLSVFLAGAILLFSGATPGVPVRLRWLHEIFPLPMVELSHFFGSLVGVALLLLARGLQQRLDAAWMLTSVMLFVGVILSLVKGGDYEEASVLGGMLLALLACRPYFYRKTPLSSQTFSWSWILAILTILGSTLWLGIFSYKHVEYSQDLWWHFSLHGNASRFLRAYVGALGLVLFISIRMVLSPAKNPPRLPTAEEIEEALAIIKNQTKTYAFLALLRDKHLLFSSNRKAFIMYGVEGRSWIAMGDPIGDKDSWVELAWEFKEACDRSAAWPVFYQIGPENIPLYLDLGLSLLKLGEDASVPLTDFTLEGKSRKGLRYAYNHGVKDGCSLEILPPHQVPAMLPILKAISDEWLALKNTREKGFSLGRFDAEYLSRTPVALIRRGQEIVAFANVWEGSGKEELSIDLMRHRSSAPDLIMEFLIVSLMIKGSADGYRFFNLGMAPLAGFDKRSLNPTWYKLAGLIFRNGEHFYNFKGLRFFKDKFHPEWQPRYLAAPGGFALPRILTNLAALISGGIKGIVSK